MKYLRKEKAEQKAKLLIKTEHLQKLIKLQMMVLVYSAQSYRSHRLCTVLVYTDSKVIYFTLGEAK